ncbi:MAG: [FeFe] hydrogenase H-cluster radical SAM maturase HydG, partial [Oscillospiraceae bacterium]
MFNSKSEIPSEFINDEEIVASLKYGEENSGNEELIKEILAKAEKFIGLTHREVAVLLYACENNEKSFLRDGIYKLAIKIKEHIYGKRIVMFAPLYLSNYCINGCKYCGYHSGSNITRKKMSQEELATEVKAIEAMGHKRVVIESGEDPKNNPIEYITECMKTIYATKNGNGEIRRINVNIAATSVENFKKLKDAGIGTYTLFQETYHRPTYQNLHPHGPKSDYDYHTTAHDRAMQGGIDDVGIGVLFGLYEYKYEVIAMMLHVAHLDATFGVGPHTISV